MPPAVSVVIPVFNRPETIHRAIDSVRAQTIQDFEIVVVDDASTDGTAASVAALVDRRITLIRHERNRGGSAARNSGIQASSAPYIAFLDSDDEWLPTKLERQLALFAQSDDRLGLVHSGFERILPEDEIEICIPVAHDDLALTLLTENVIGGTSNGMVPRRVFDQIGGFDEGLASAQDVDLWLRIAQQFSVAFVPEVLARIWQRNEGARITANVASLIKGRALFCEKHRDELLRRGRLHVWLRQTGWVHQRYARDLRMARALYVSAIRTRPSAPSSYLLLLTACLPLTWLDGLVGGKHLIVRGFGYLRDVTRRQRIVPGSPPRRAFERSGTGDSGPS